MIDPAAEMERIKARASELGWSQAELARRSGMDVASLNRLWNGKRKLGVRTFNQLEAALTGLPPPQHPRSIDPEFAAMQALVDLPDDARARVLAWASARWP